jgi:RimJ/RimL family protein N-acetyltransferase
MGFPETFTTARLRADRLTEADWTELCRMHQDPTVMTHLGGVRTAEWTAAYLERNLRHWDEHGFGLWILRQLDGGEPIGRAVLRHLLVDGIDEVEVGYGFYEAYWGQGLATEVTRACLRFGFEVLHRGSVVGVTSPANVGSQHVLTKCGMVYEREADVEGQRMALFRTQRGRPPMSRG